MMPGFAQRDGDAMDPHNCVEARWLACELQRRDPPPLVVDCRPAAEYHESHVLGAISASLPASAIMLRRLANGKLSLPSIIKDRAHLDKFTSLWKRTTVVLYDADSCSRSRPLGPNVLSTLFRRLRNEGCRVLCLQGGFEEFRQIAPEACQGEAGAEAAARGLEGLRLGPPETGRELCDSGLGRDPPFPVEILPFLFLGNAENSEDLEGLARHKIRYVLNVTANLPNTFEGVEPGIKYMQIPIQDHWSQNLASFFPDAISFIDEARQKREGILVHCLAGVSRSVTITLAYLMQKLSMSLNDAYDFVRQRKANISPNFNFMGQLMDFERQLNQSSGRCTCLENPCRCLTLHFISPTRTTPDSGIDIDRWT